MKQIDDKKTIDVNSKLEGELSKERDEWNEKIIDLIESMKDTRKLSESQVIQLSYRQQVQERLASYRILHEQRQNVLENLMKDRFREYSISYDLKLSGAEKTAFINADCGAMKLQVSMIKTQITFFEECVKTLDNFGFAIRNKIEIISQQLI